LLVGSSSLPSGLDAKVFSVIPRADGTFRLKAGKWPLYRFAGDTAAGEVNGQGSGGAWFAIAPDGALTKN
jgi:predicted lipoprotein with Yx(FWY)xxD motif